LPVGCQGGTSTPARRLCHPIGFKANEALSVPFRVTGSSFEGNFLPESPLNLPIIADLFGIKGSVHPVRLPAGTFPLEIGDVLTEQKNKSGRRLVNFIVVKFQFLGLKLSFKLYARGYTQLFGFSDTFDPLYSAEELALLVAEFVAEFITMGPTGVRVAPATSLTVLALTASHTGVSGCGLRFDLDALERAFAARFASNADLVLSRNHRNASLIVREGPKSGSSMFHGTGTIQLMGVRRPPSEFLQDLRELVSENSDVLIVSADTPRKKKRRRATAESAPKRPRVALAIPVVDNVIDTVSVVDVADTASVCSGEEDSSLLNSPSPSTPDTLVNDVIADLQGSAIHEFFQLCMLPQEEGLPQHLGSDCADELDLEALLGLLA